MSVPQIPQSRMSIVTHPADGGISSNCRYSTASWPVINACSYGTHQPSPSGLLARGRSVASAGCTRGGSARDAAEGHTVGVGVPTPHVARSHDPADTLTGSEQPRNRWTGLAQHLRIPVDSHAE